MDVHHQTISATDVNTSVTLPFPCSSLIVDNQGTDAVWVNVSGSGVAVAADGANVRIRGATSLTLTSGRGQAIRAVGAICAAGETATVSLTASLLDE